MENRNTITIRVDFRDRKETDLQQINDILAAMPLKDMELEGTAGYIAVTRNAAGRVINRRYGLDEATLVCHLADSETGYCYQLDTMVSEPWEDREGVLQSWREENPGRAMRIAITVGTDNGLGYIIAHHQKETEKPALTPRPRRKGLFLLGS